MRKKILIVTHKMVMGGIEKSLLSMINTIDKNKYYIDIFVVEEGGELLNEIPNWINVQIVPGSKNSIFKRIYNAIKIGKISEGCNIFKYSILTKLTKDNYKGFYYYPNINNKVYTEYDLAIAYHTPMGFPTGYVINNIKAKKKIIYIHGDMEQHKEKKEFYNLIYMYKKYYYKYDKIFCVSNQAKDKFLKYYSEFRDKTEVFYNILDKNEISKKSLDKNNFQDSFDGIRILTVGRLSEEKGQLIIPTIVKRLINNNIDIRWYLIGEGELRNLLEKTIKELEIQDNLILLGNKRNPYSFIKNSDIYVQTSIYEGFCITLAEAKILNKPIITTNFVGVNDQIVNGKNGMVVNRTEEELYKGIKILIENNKLRILFENNLRNNQNNHEYEIEKIYRIFE